MATVTVKESTTKQQVTATPQTANVTSTVDETVVTTSEGENLSVTINEQNTQVSATRETTVINVQTEPVQQQVTVKPFGTVDLTSASAIQGESVSSVTPTDGDVLQYNESQSEYQPTDGRLLVEDDADLADNGDLDSPDLTWRGYYDSDVSGTKVTSSRDIDARLVVNYASGAGEYRLGFFNNSGNEFVSFEGDTQRVGIGTASPSTKLEVSGGVTLNGDLQTADGDVLWDESASYIPQGRLENDTVTVAGNAVALGGSTGISHSDLTGIGAGDHHTRYSDEEAQDAVNSLLTAGTLLSKAYDDAGNNLTLDVDPIDPADLNFDPATQSELDSHTATAGAHHTRYSDEEAQDAVGTILSDSSSVNFTYDDAGNSITATVTASAVDHGSLSGLGDDDHPHYAEHGAAETISAGWTFTALQTFQRAPGAGTANFLTLKSGDTQDQLQYRLDGNDHFVLRAVDDSASANRNIWRIDPASTQMNMLATLNFPNVTGTPTFAGHDHSEGGMATVPNTGLVNSSLTVAGNSVSLGGSTAVDHADLSNIGSNDHHAKYKDEEAQDAVGTILSSQFTYDDATPSINIDPHTNTSDAHHIKTTSFTDLTDSIADGQVPQSAVTQHEAAIDHDLLTNFVSNEHINHANVAIQSGTGLQGGGDITTTRTLALNAVISDINNVNISTVGGGEVLQYDGANSEWINQTLSEAGIAATGHTHSSGDITDFDEAAQDAVGAMVDTSLTYTDSGPTLSVNESGVAHDSLSGYVANEHVDHSTVSISSGTGLSGGGDITASRTISLNAVINDLNNVNTTPSGGDVLQYDGGASEWVAGSTSASAAGSDGEVQYNNGGSLGGATTLHWDDGDNNLGIGRTALGRHQVVFGGTHTVSEAQADVAAIGLRTSFNLTSGNTGNVAMFGDVAGATAITTQGASETISNVVGYLFRDPAITVGTGDTITNASTVKVTGQPVEGSNNYALWVDQGTTRLDGDVGIGTGSPSTKLEVNAGTDGASRFFARSAVFTDIIGTPFNSTVHAAQNQFHLTTLSAGGVTQTGSIVYHGGGEGGGDHGHLLFSSNSHIDVDRSTNAITGNVHLAIDPSGSVGIGTASPSSLLTLSSGSSIEWETGSNAKLLLPDTNFTVFVGGHPSNDTQPFSAQLNSESQTQFYVGGSERMRIGSSGNVGIGTSSPSYALDVNGDVNVGGTLHGASHSDLSGIGSSDHHAKYTDSEARSAVEGSDSVDKIGFKNHESADFGTDGEVWHDASAGLYTVAENAGHANPALLWSSANVGAGSGIGVSYSSEDHPTLSIDSTVAQLGQNETVTGQWEFTSRLELDENDDPALVIGPSFRGDHRDGLQYAVQTSTSDFHHYQQGGHGRVVMAWNAEYNSGTDSWESLAGSEAHSLITLSSGPAGSTTDGVGIAAAGSNASAGDTINWNVGFVLDTNGGVVVKSDIGGAGPTSEGAVRNIIHHGNNSASSVGIEGTLHTEDA